MVGHLPADVVVGLEPVDVSPSGQSVVRRVELVQRGFPLCSEDSFASQILQRHVKSAEPPRRGRRNRRSVTSSPTPSPPLVHPHSLLRTQQAERSILALILSLPTPTDNIERNMASWFPDSLSRCDGAGAGRYRFWEVLTLVLRQGALLPREAHSRRRAERRNAPPERGGISARGGGGAGGESNPGPRRVTQDFSGCSRLDGFLGSCTHVSMLQPSPAQEKSLTDLRARSVKQAF